MSIVFVRVRVGGGSDRTEGGTGGGALAGTRSLLVVGSTKNDEGCESVAELVGASGSYATSEVADGMKGFSDNSHVMCALRLFRGGMRVSHR